MSKFLKDKRIEIFKYVGFKNEEGFPIDGCVSRGKFWAYTRVLSMYEYNEYGLDTKTEERLFIINYNKDIQTSDRIVYNNNEYTIRQIDTYNDYKQDMTIYATKRQFKRTGD